MTRTRSPTVVSHLRRPDCPVNKRNTVPSSMLTTKARDIPAPIVYTTRWQSSTAIMVPSIVCVFSPKLDSDSLRARCSPSAAAAPTRARGAAAAGATHGRRGSSGIAYFFFSARRARRGERSCRRTPRSRRQTLRRGSPSPFPGRPRSRTCTRPSPRSCASREGCRCRRSTDA